LNQVSTRLENNKKVSLVGVVLGICMIVVILVAYGQISILQKNTSNLQSNNSSLSNQIAALEAEKASLLNQTAALEKDKANLQQQVASQENKVSSLAHDVTSLHAQFTALQHQLAQIEGKNPYLILHPRVRALCVPN